MRQAAEAVSRSLPGITVLRNISEAIWIKDLVWKFLFCSKETCQIGSDLFMIDRVVGPLHQVINDGRG